VELPGMFFCQRSSSELVVWSLELPGTFLISDPLQGSWWGPWNCPACFLSAILFRAGGVVPGTARHVFYQRSSSGLVVGSLELPQSVVELKLIAHKLEEIKLQLKVSQQTRPLEAKNYSNNFVTPP
jgi:hypothetical protein